MAQTSYTIVVLLGMTTLSVRPQWGHFSGYLGRSLIVTVLDLLGTTVSSLTHTPPPWP